MEQGRCTVYLLFIKLNARETDSNFFSLQVRHVENVLNALRNNTTTISAFSFHP